MLDQITVVIGVDAKTLPQYEVSHRTWKLHRPEMYSWPWVVFYDGDNLSVEHGVRRMMDEGKIPASAEVVAWPQCLGLKKNPKYESQREKMLTGFVYAPPMFVKTKWWLKIDTDAVCLRRGVWPNEKWFEPENGVFPSVVAPGWSYTKGVGFLDRLEEWGDKITLRCLPRLNIQHDPTHLRVPHPRWCSWNSFYNTEWTRGASAHLTSGDIPGMFGRLPVPSQDTYHWYVAERTKRLVRKVNMKACGWTNCSKMHALVETVRQVMAGSEMEAMGDG